MGKQKGGSNRNLTAARKAKKDEFYTTREVVEDELKWYKDDFQGHPVLCNCNDWPNSEFVKFFMRKMSSWNIPKLTAIGYRDTVGTLFENGRGTKYELINDGRPADQPYTEKDFIVTELNGDGSFDSPECEALLDESNVIVCTNPPFSRFREFLPMLDRHGISYLIVGNINAVTYKEIFPIFIKNNCWLGISLHGARIEFQVPEDYPLLNSTNRIDDEGRHFITINGGIRWFTNLGGGRVGKNNLNLEGNRYYGNEDKYPKYDNYDAINVDKVADIPEDYFGEIGVPITFLDKWAPEPNSDATHTHTHTSMVIGRERRELSDGRIQLGNSHLPQRNQEIQEAHHPAFQVIGLDRYVPNNPRPGYRFTIKGKETYARMIVQRSA